MNAGVFTTLFIVLILIVLFFTVSEGFQVKEPVLHIPESPVVQKNLVEKSQEDYAPNYILAPGPAPGAIASFNSLPYRDPSLEKAKYQRILNVQTTLKGFLDNEATGLEDLSDPSIQLPQTSARADLAKLSSEVLVLKRNPGIDSSLTQNDIDEIQANLAYLQKKWRLSIYNDLNDVEGFQDASGSEITDPSSTPSNSNSPFDTPSNFNSPFDTPSNSNAPFDTLSNSNALFGTPSNSNALFGTPSNSNALFGTPSNSNTPTIASNPISLSELRDLINKIDVTKSRLTSSGTTDPIVLARVSVLDKIKKKVQDILNEVVAGARKESEIPITKDAYTEFLKSIADTTSPVSKLFGSNVALADLLPAYSQGDVNGAKLAQYLFTKYSDMLFKGLSFNVNFNYTSPAEQQLAENIARSISDRYNSQNVTATAKLLQAYDVNTSNNNFSAPIGQNMGNYSNGYNASIFSDLSNKYFGSNSSTPNDVLSNYNYKNNAAPFDWQERANFICDSVQKRGLNPKDFGCLRPDEYVSENFSWRGYAKMICGRLATSMDTGLPEICGCPPESWAGWRP